MTFRPWKWCLLFTGLVLFAGFVWFGFLVFRFHQALKKGGLDPLVKQRLQTVFRREKANTQVTASDLKALIDPRAPSMGAASTTLTIVEFLDYSCPFSKASFEPVREFVEKNADKVKLIIRDFPVEETHPRAIFAALAARCAHRQGKFWHFHDKLFQNQNRFEDADFFRYAKEVGLDEETFSSCYQQQIYKKQIGKDMEVGLQVGVEGTPTFFFNGVRISSSVDLKTLEFLSSQAMKP